jgi:hypothetical protein
LPTRESLVRTCVACKITPTKSKGQIYYDQKCKLCRQSSITAAAAQQRQPAASAPSTAR